MFATFILIIISNINIISWYTKIYVYQFTCNATETIVYAEAINSRLCNSKLVWFICWFLIIKYTFSIWIICFKVDIKISTFYYLKIQ